MPHNITSDDDLIRQSIRRSARTLRAGAADRLFRGEVQTLPSFETEQQYGAAMQRIDVLLGKGEAISPTEEGELAALFLAAADYEDAHQLA